MARRWRREIRQALLACLLLLVAYFVIPVSSDPDTAPMTPPGPTGPPLR